MKKETIEPLKCVLYTVLGMLIVFFLYTSALGIYWKVYMAGYREAKADTIDCEEIKKIGERTNFGGDHYEIYECYVNKGDWKNYWKFEKR